MENMPAPLVVAKGQRLVAQRIKEIAVTQVSLGRDKPLARALFKVARLVTKYQRICLRLLRRSGLCFQQKRGNEESAQ